MRIVKSICHLGVDKMLKAALGDMLTIVRFRDKDGKANDLNGWVGDEGIPFDFTYDMDDEYDIKIVDDSTSFETLKHVKARHTIWYVHGTYHLWGNFKRYWNREVKGVHILFPDSDREKYINTWYKNKPQSKLFLPIHLTDDYFSEIPKERNGLSCAVGNSLYSTCQIYGNMNVVDQVMQDMSVSGTHLYGFNEVTPPVYDKRLVKGNAYPIKEVIKPYSVGIFPSFVKTVGYALLETLAAGVPVICTDKVSEYRELCALANTPQDFKRWTRRYLKNEQLSLDVGAQNQYVLKKYYNISKYSEKLLEWIENLP